jgi:sulfonate transport system permease protein
MAGDKDGAMKHGRFPRRLAAPAFLLALWQGLASAGLVNESFVGSPLGVATSLYTLFAEQGLAHDLAISLWRALFGLTLGALSGLAFGVIVGLSRWGEDIFDSTLQAIRTLPLLGLIPLFILWFGLGETPRIILIALGSFFPVYLNVFKGIRGVDIRLIELAEAYGLTRYELVRDIVLPDALPSFLVGLRYSIGVAWLCLVVAEQVNATSGLGWVIIQANQLGQTSVIITALAIYAIVGIMADGLIRLVEARALRWRQAFKGT